MLPAALASSKCFALQAELHGKFLQSVYRDKASGSRVEPSADTVVSNARTRFLVEPSKEESGLMHVRCGYNNRYWVPVLVLLSGSSSSSSSHRWVIGTAHEQDENLSSPSCTLFRPLPVKDKDNSIRFLHPVLQKFARVVSIGNKTSLQLHDDGDDQENNSNNFIVVGLSEHKELPKHVAFKGDNGKYLGTKNLRMNYKLPKASGTWGHVEKFLPPGSDITLRLASSMFHFKYNKFHTEDIGDASVIFTTIPNDDGTVRITSNKGGFWKRNIVDNFILTLDVVHKSDRDGLFEVVTGNGFVALRNLGNNKFCKRISADGRQTSCLSACDDTISQWARLKLEEPFLRSEISDVKFHLDEARIYNKKIFNVVSVTRINKTSRELKATFSFTKKVEMVSKWETNLSSNKGVHAKISSCSSGMPIILCGEVTFSTESTTSEGHTTTESNIDETTITEEYSMPPGTKLAGTLVATRASSDVPYSYKQTDVLTTGDVVTTIHDDGIYTVTNNYNFHITLTDDEDEISKLVE